MVNGNHPQMAKHFRLVKYEILPRCIIDIDLSDSYIPLFPTYFSILYLYVSICHYVFSLFGWYLTGDGMYSYSKVIEVILDMMRRRSKTSFGDARSMTFVVDDILIAFLRGSISDFFKLSSKMGEFSACLPHIEPQQTGVLLVPQHPVV